MTEIACSCSGSLGRGFGGGKVGILFSLKVFSIIRVDYVLCEDQSNAVLVDSVHFLICSAVVSFKYDSTDSQMTRNCRL